MRCTHIDDFVESLRVVTPAGIAESRRLPGSGAGPSPDRMFLGSEGTLGVITEAWLRLRARPVRKAAVDVRFGSFSAGLAAVRTAAYACWTWPGRRSTPVPGHGSAVLVLGFESATIRWPAHWPGPASSPPTTAVHTGGCPLRTARTSPIWSVPDGRAFLRMPYSRDALARLGVVVETVETACTWDRAAGLYGAVRAEVGAAIERLCKEPGILTCRTTHVYPDGVAPYVTVLVRGSSGC
jgi:alkyldihydroxyacetonephosphate synthase